MVRGQMGHWMPQRRPFHTPPERFGPDDAAAGSDAKSFERREGGRTMSRSAFGDVVRGYPAVLRGAVGVRPHGTIGNRSKSYLIHDIEIVFEGGRTHSAKVIVQNIAKCLQECKCNQRIGYNPEGSEMRRHGDIVGPSPSPETLTTKRSSPISTWQHALPPEKSPIPGGT
jgi:hypothetical protein